MVRFCAQVALHQTEYGRHFVIENRKGSAIWRVHCFQQLLKQEAVTWDNLNFCSWGMQDPVSKDFYNKATSLMHEFPDGILNPILRTCPGNHKHQIVEGWCKGHGRRAALTQVYPYGFCKSLATTLQTSLGVVPMDNDSLLINDILAALAFKWKSTRKRQKFQSPQNIS